jgi:hypothetical protein
VEEKPIEIRNLPPNLEIIKIQKKEVVKAEEPIEVIKAEEPAEVKAVEPVPVVKKRGCTNCGKRKKA